MPARPEPSRAPAEPPRTTGTSRRNFLGLVAVGVVGVGVYASTRNRAGKQTTPITVPAGVTAFVVQIDNADLTIRGTDGAPGAVVSTSPSLFGDDNRSTPYRTSQSGTTFTIVVDRSDATLDLALPAAASVRVQASNGDVRGEGAVAQSVDITGSNGDVDLDFDQAPKTVSVRTTNGDVTLDLPTAAADDGYTYQVSTRHGDRDVPPDSGTRPVAVTTTNGDITIRQG